MPKLDEDDDTAYDQKNNDRDDNGQCQVLSQFGLGHNYELDLVIFLTDELPQVTTAFIRINDRLWEILAESQVGSRFKPIRPGDVSHMADYFGSAEGLSTPLTAECLGVVVRFNLVGTTDVV